MCAMQVCGGIKAFAGHAATTTRWSGVSRAQYKCDGLKYGIKCTGTARKGETEAKLKARRGVSGKKWPKEKCKSSNCKLNQWMLYFRGSCERENY